MIKIIADNKIPFLKGALEGVAHVEYLSGSKICPNDVSDADALITRTRTKCCDQLLKGSSVKFIASATIGYDHVDVAFCEANNVKWTNAPGCNSGSVKQYISSAIAEIIRKDSKKFKDITLGIIGVGNVGSKVESMANVLGTKTLLNDPPRQRKEGNPKFMELEKVICQSDIITMHVPLTFEGIDKTFHMIDDAVFSKMKKGAWFINTSRGEITETQALINAIKSRKIAGAVIDVWENEPDISKELANLAFISTPHIAGYSLDGKANGTSMSVQAVSRFFNLGLDNWYPASIPQPQNPVIELSNNLNSIEDIFCKLSLHTYDILKDSETLKNSLDTFELQRENYPVRREPPAFKVKTNNIDSEMVSIVKGLGFEIHKIKS